MVSLRTYIKQDLNWWMDNLVAASGKDNSLTNKLEIFSDPSLTGWGACCDGAGWQGEWTDKERVLYINHLELKAALLALKCFAQDLRVCNILLRVENTTALSYINKMGGVKFEKLHYLAREFWDWCDVRNLWVKATYIAIRHRMGAGRLWILANITSFGRTEIDLLATGANNKCEKHCSWRRDPNAFVIDAFTIDWSEWFFYAFSPFGIIA